MGRHRPESVTDGAGTFTVTGTVSRGSADRPVATVTVTDAADPVVTVGSEADGADGWWVTAPATATVSATDDTGVASVEHSLDGGAWVSVSGDSASLEVAGDGVHEVRARAHDVTGNTSAVVTGSVKVDTEAPVSRASRSGRTVTVRAADATSGVDAVEYRLDGGAWTSYTGAFGVGDDAVDVRVPRDRPGRHGRGRQHPGGPGGGRRAVADGRGGGRLVRHGPLRHRRADRGAGHDPRRGRNRQRARDRRGPGPRLGEPRGRPGEHRGRHRPALPGSASTRSSSGTTATPPTAPARTRCS